MNKTTADSNDTSLLCQIEQGNSFAFDALFEKYWEQAFSNAYQRLKDTDEAKDIVQDIFAHIWENKETHIDNFPAYLHIAIRNRVFKSIAKQKKSSPFLDVLQQIPATSMQSDAGLLWKELYRSYEQLLNGLPPQRRTILRLRFQENMNTREIAAHLGLSRKTVQNHLGKAVKQLRVSISHLFSFLLMLL